MVSGASSMKARQIALDVISNNIANANTSGFKSSRVNFADQFSQIYGYGRSPNAIPGSSNGGSDPSQIGLGVKVGSVTKDMSQGMIESTGRPLDLALQGDGFFIVHRNGQEFYTRAGAFTLDDNGNMVDYATVAFVQGYNPLYGADGTIVKDSSGANLLAGKVENLRIPPDIVSAPRQTQNVSLSGNLSASNEAGYERSTSINIFDNQGNVHSLTITFTKTENPGEYSLAAKIDDKDVAIGDATVVFNADGSLSSPTETKIAASDLNSALGATAFDADEPKDIAIKFKDAKNAVSGGLTNYGGSNSLTFKSQDGYQAGSLLDAQVDREGVIWGSFSNGQSEVLGQVAIAKFANPNGLVSEGDNYYAKGPDSGPPFVGTAVSTFESTSVQSKALEMSNVDLTTEFVNMITAQRAFEASSRIIMTSDQMLAQLGLIKR